jgi:hypothetical protein
MNRIAGERDWAPAHLVFRGHRREYLDGVNMTDGVFERSSLDQHLKERSFEKLIYRAAS